MKTRDKAERYLEQFTRPQAVVVCRVYASGLAAKPRALSDIYLARWMRITSRDWREALEEAHEEHLLLSQR